jgi:hypothetical protein
MSENDIVAELIKKVQDGESTAEEELTLLRYLNDTAKILLPLIEAVKVEQLVQTIKKHTA